MERGPISFGISDPKEKYGKLVPNLVYVNTHDFRLMLPPNALHNF